MDSHVYKFIALASSSTVSIDDAIRNAVETASKTIRHLDWFQVIETQGDVADGKIAHFQVTLKVALGLES